MNKSLKQSIEDYYQAFNDERDDVLFSLLDKDVLHEINQSHQEIGIDKFRQFIKRFRSCFVEKVSDLTIFTNESSTRGSAEFIVKGAYIQTEPPLPPANNQTYSLRMGAFFALQKGKINRITTYYNQKEWLSMMDTHTFKN